MDEGSARELLKFIEAGPTAFHVAEKTAAELRASGFEELREGERWRVRAPGKYFVRRNGSALIALNVPKPDFAGFMIMAAHGDSPAFKVKENAEAGAAGMYTQLNVEKYGGMICSSWLDRPLSVAGRLVVRDGARLTTRLVDVRRDLLLIPGVAIHMDRGANENKTWNANTDMQPLFAAGEPHSSFDGIVASAAGVRPEDVLARDLFLYPRTPGTVWGSDGQFVSSPRLDDLQCVFACLRGFLAAEAGGSAGVLCVFDNEEVGSSTKQGANSDFLAGTLERMCDALGMTAEDRRAALSNSFMVSADNAHAVHPNHPEYADRLDRPELNRGVVIKYNANQKYTTDAVSAAVFRRICADAGVPVQSFTNRADLPGGSTLGNISSAHVSVDTVDIGLPQLAMHSCYETAGVKDTDYLIAAAREFFGRSFRRAEFGVEL